MSQVILPDLFPVGPFMSVNRQNGGGIVRHMQLCRRLGVLTIVLGLMAGAGCAGVKPTATTGTGGSGNGSGSGTGGNGNHPFDGGSIDLPTTITMTCGNGMLDPGEACDDHNAIGGDGCSKICQIESGWSCSAVG